MEVVYIDSEPPGPAGGGIRTYLRLALGICRDAGVPAVVYTHTPDAYPGHEARPIGRKPWLSRPWRSLAYRLDYGENVLWEHARWLRDELEAAHVPGRVYEFCDYQGYAFFALRSPWLRPHTVVRVHTPAYLTLPRPRGLREKVSAALLAYRERDCLLGRARVTLPSATFAAERLPWLKGGLHLPNPLPPSMAAPAAPTSNAPALAAPAPVVPNPGSVRFLYLGRIEARKGVLTLLAGFLRLAKQDPGVTLTVAGAEVQPYADKVRAHLSSAPEELTDRITWMPPVPPEGLPALFARHDALAVPSLWENSPYVYFEGMAAGILCIGSATGEMREAASACGGILAAPGDPEDWTRALAEAAAACRDPDRRRTLASAQHAYLEDRRSGIPDRMLACYRELAEIP